MSFTSCRVFKEANGIQHRIVEQDDYQLKSDYLIIRIQYSGVNYKDALGATGTAPIYKRFPINAGIDCAGVVEQCADPRFKEGDMVFVNGCGLGEVQDGGLAQRVMVPVDWVMPLPANLSAKTAMIYGTAGFTAALAVDRMIQNGQSIDMGPVLVTGASGGVGSFAITILSMLGYEVIAVSGRQQHYDYLKQLGADQVQSVEQLELGSQPLERAKFGGVVDNVGGDLLAASMAHTNLWGNVASIGMAASPKLNSTVFPLILRGVSVLGVSSTNCPMPRRQKVWQWIADEVITDKLDLILEHEVPLAEVSPYFNAILERRHRGRIIVNCD